MRSQVVALVYSVSPLDVTSQQEYLYSSSHYLVTSTSLYLHYTVTSDSTLHFYSTSSVS